MTITQGLPYRRCVGVMLVNGQGYAWVGRRADRPDGPEGLGKWWQMPQGGVGDDEDAEIAARRELDEETGVRNARFIAKASAWYSYDLPSKLVGVAWEGRFRGQTQLWFLARFEGEESEIDIAPKAGLEREFDAWRWVPLAALPDLVVPFKRRIYESVIKEFRPLVLER
jgi:putative (di)nucleoside polyphosphate hydrolase